eukprot:1196154-Prorocentrum_minimum.AAC.2
MLQWIDHRPVRIVKIEQHKKRRNETYSPREKLPLLAQEDPCTSANRWGSHHLVQVVDGLQREVLWRGKRAGRPHRYRPGVAHQLGLVVQLRHRLGQNQQRGHAVGTKASRHKSSSARTTATCRYVRRRISSAGALRRRISSRKPHAFDAVGRVSTRATENTTATTTATTASRTT